MSVDILFGSNRRFFKVAALLIFVNFRWTAVATWRWVANDDSCGICRMPFDACCSDCKLPGDDCPLGMDYRKM